MLIVVVIVIAVVVIILAGGAKGKAAENKAAGRTTTGQPVSTHTPDYKAAGRTTTDHSKTTTTRSTDRSTDHTRYEKSGNWMDFDIGRDEKKVGDPKYPKAGIDSVMKHEFMDDLLNDK